MKIEKACRLRVGDKVAYKVAGKNKDRIGSICRSYPMSEKLHEELNHCWDIGRWCYIRGRVVNPLLLEDLVLHIADGIPYMFAIDQGLHSYPGQVGRLPQVLRFYTEIELPSNPDIETANVFADWLEDRGHLEAAQELRRGFPIAAFSLPEDIA